MIDWEAVWKEFGRRVDADEAYDDPEGMTTLAYNWEAQRKLIEDLVDQQLKGENSAG